MEETTFKRIILVRFLKSGRDVDWIQVVQDMSQQRAVVDTVMNNHFAPYECCRFQNTVATNLQNLSQNNPEL
jgi:hypothetical protein